MGEFRTGRLKKGTGIFINPALFIIFLI
jgi:hypothetical protein